MILNTINMSLANHGQASRKARRQFSNVLGQARLDKAAPLALRLRRKLDKKNSVRRWKRKALTCMLMTPPMNGFYNLVYQIQFSDGSRWALKVSRRGHDEEWSELAERALLSEVLTMKLIKRETTIPIPDVYDYNATLNNVLGCPYMIMEWLSGEPLIKHWDRYVDKDAPSLVGDDHKRVRLLLDITQAMVQLDRYEFRKCGSPVFDDKGNFVDIGPLITRDFGAETVDEMPKLIEVGPFDNCVDYMSWKVKQYGPDNKAGTGNGHQILYFAFLNWTRELIGKDNGFIFAHTDFGPQNVLIDNHGRFCGLIDFDGITAVPRLLSNSRGGAYPHWLTRDQDLWEGEEVEPPSMNSSVDDLVEQLSTLTVSTIPAELNPVDHESADFWRAIYRICLQQAYIAEKLGTKHTGFGAGKGLLSVDEILASVPRTYDEGLTPAHSLDGRILLIAAHSPDTMLPAIVESIVGKIGDLHVRFSHLLGHDGGSVADSAIESDGGIPDHMMAGTILAPSGFVSRDVVGDVGGGRLVREDWSRLEAGFKYILTGK